MFVTVILVQLHISHMDTPLSSVFVNIVVYIRTNYKLYFNRFRFKIVFTCAVGDESSFFVLFGVGVLCDIACVGADISAVIKGEALFHIQLRLLFLCA